VAAPRCQSGWNRPRHERGQRLSGPRHARGKASARAAPRWRNRCTRHATQAMRAPGRQGTDDRDGNQQDVERRDRGGGQCSELDRERGAGLPAGVVPARHEPLTLVANGQAEASSCGAGSAGPRWAWGWSRSLRRLPTAGPDLSRCTSKLTGSLKRRDEHTGASQIEAELRPDLRRAPCRTTP
jgi:hypothetical protein